MATDETFAITVVGGGLTGLSAALTLAPLCERQGTRLALVAPTTVSKDGRTTALLMPSIDMLDGVGLWQSLKPLAAPLRTMRLIDGTKRLIRAPIAEFKAAELDMEAFGYNVPNAAMVIALEEAISNNPNIERFSANAGHAAAGEDWVKITLDNGQSIVSKAVAAADGRNSLMREAADISIEDWSYPQTAIVLSFSHTLPHNSVSTEFHTETGPFTQVPLPPTANSLNRSSLVWVVKPEEAEMLLALGNEELASIAETKMQSYLGALVLEGPPQSFPLSGMKADRFAQNRTFVLGEAGHVFPPIGAQGFNLGLRDIVSLKELLASATDTDWGSTDRCEQFHRQRLTDVSMSTGAVDLLNRSLLADFLPVQAARALGLAAAGSSSWFRRLLMKQGLGARPSS